MHTLSAQLLTVARRFAEVTECELASASYRTFGDSRILPRLAQGEASTTLRRADHALLWFSENWPTDAAWPSGIPRPSHSDFPDSAGCTDCLPDRSTDIS